MSYLDCSPGGDERYSGAHASIMFNGKLYTIHEALKISLIRAFIDDLNPHQSSALVRIGPAYYTAVPESREDNHGYAGIVITHPHFAEVFEAECPELDGQAVGLFYEVGKEKFFLHRSLTEQFYKLLWYRYYQGFPDLAAELSEYQSIYSSHVNPLAHDDAKIAQQVAKEGVESLRRDAQELLAIMKLCKEATQ